MRAIRETGAFLVLLLAAVVSLFWWAFKGMTAFLAVIVNALQNTSDSLRPRPE